MARALMAVLLSLSLVVPPSTMPAAAAGGERTLYLRHTHTGDVGRFTFKRNGQYDQRVLNQLNVFLADWRTKEPTTMDPLLFDLLWMVYQEVRGTEPINIVSSYRSPKTNAMLASRSSGVADNSQHMRGKAIDFFIPGIPISRVREVGMKYQVGGVGFYPSSGSPFVHLDTGSVRAWPRMTRAQLQKIFPDGRTLHLPSDGNVLSNDGRRYAEAEWQKCHMVPCNGAPAAATGGSGTTMVAATTAPVPARPSANLLDRLLGRDVSQPPPAQVATAYAAEPTQRVVQSIDIAAPVPMMRPSPDGAVASAPYDGPAPIPAQKSPRILLATGPSLPTIARDPADTAVVALASLGPAPEPRVHLTAKDDIVLTAYAPTIAPDPEAQRALQMIIERETTASLRTNAAPPAFMPPVQSAALGFAPAPRSSALGAIGSIFEGTWAAVAGSDHQPLAAALETRLGTNGAARFEQRAVELLAPDLDHVADTMVHAVPMADQFYGELLETEGYFDKQAELGALARTVGFVTDDTPIPRYDRFQHASPLLVASR